MAHASRKGIAASRDLGLAMHEVAIAQSIVEAVADRPTIDAVGVGAYTPDEPATQEQLAAAAGGELEWTYGAFPSQAARWAVECVAKAGTVGVIGVYPPSFDAWPIGTRAESSAQRARPRGRAMDRRCRSQRGRHRSS